MKSADRVNISILVRTALTGVLLLVGVSAVAQLTTATISGVVKDPTGGVIPRVAITVTN